MPGRDRTLPLAVLVAGLVASGLAVHAVQRSDQQALQAQSRAMASGVADQAIAQLEHAALGLRGARGYFLGAGADQVTQAGFRAYFDTRSLTQEFPGVMGVGFIRRVAPGSEADLVASARRRGSPDFSVRALTPHDGERQVIQFVEPMETNRAAVGLDVASESNRRETARLALQVDAPILTGPIRLVQSAPSSSLGMLMMMRMPVSAGSPGHGIAQGPVGLVYAPIQLDQLLQSIGLDKDVAQVQVVDVTDVTRPQDFLLPKVSAPVAAAVAPVVLDRQVMGRQWQFTVVPLQAFADGVQRGSPWRVGAVAVLISVLLALLTQATLRLRRTLQTQRTERARLSSLLDHASDAIVVLDLQGRVTMWNKSATGLFGFTSEEALTHSLSELTVDAAHAAEDARLLQAAAAGRSVAPFETQRRHRSGESVDVELSSGPVFDEAGAVVGIAKVLRPIKERREAARRLALHAVELENQVAERTRQHLQAEQDLRNVLDAMPSMVGSWDRHLRNRFANKGYSAFFARDPDALRGTHLQDLLGPTLFALNRPYIDGVLRGEEQRFERDIPVPGEGRVRHTWAHYLPQRQDGEVVGFYVLVHDVTELKRVQTRLQNIIDGTQAGTWEWNVATGEVTFNARWAEIVGYTLDELQPVTIDTWTSLVHPEDLARSSALLEAHFQGEAPAYACEARMRHKDGHWVWVLDRGKLISRTPQGEPMWMAGTHQDITERKLAEQALMHSQALLARTGAVARVGGWEVDLTTGVIWWSDETCRIHGLPVGHRPTMDEALSYYAPEARPVIQSLVERGMRKGLGWDVELPFIRADGQHIWVRALGEVQFDGAAPVRLVGAFQDVTARHEAAAALQAEQAVTQAMLESAPVAVLVARRRDNRIGLLNERFARLVRRTVEQARELDIAACYVTREDAVDIQRRLDLGEAIVDRLVALRLPDQPEVPHLWVLASYMAIDHLGEPSVLAWLYDVTELQQARESARSAEELMHEALNVTQTGLAIYDQDDRLAFCNPRYRELHSRIGDLLLPGTPFEVIARASLARYAPVDAPPDPQLWWRERVTHHRDGGEFIHHIDGRHVRVVERAMRNGQFVSMRQDLTEVVRSQEAAEAASRAKSAFLASTSHEIRTPLNAILGLAYLLERGELTAQDREQVRQIAQAGRSLLALVNDVLDISKIEAGQLEVESVDFDLQELVRDEATLHAVGLQGRPVSLRVAIEDDVPATVRGDPTRLRQVLANLLSNAGKFTQQGLIEVRVARGDKLPWMELEVSDTGLGIDPQARQRLFKPFEQADVSTARRFGGTGLGLAITSQLVALMGGSISLDSAPGLGSTFTVTLPLPETEASALVSGGGEVAPLRVLLADDDDIQLGRLLVLGRSLGWQCRAVDGGHALLDEALAAARGGTPYDALVVDWKMPDLDGLSALDRLRRQLPQDVWPATVVVSQHEWAELQAAPHVDLASAMLVKPFDGSRLFNAVNQSVAAIPERADRLLESSQVGQADSLWLAGLHVLVVDDSSINLDVARKVLELEGAKVTTCASGEEALALALEAGEGFDAALLDIQMPDMDGIELLQRLRRLAVWAARPVIALTAGVQREEREAAVAAGMTDFLSKPLEPRRLIKCLRRHVEARRGAPVPVLPRVLQPALSAEVLRLDIDGIDEEAIVPSVRQDRALLLSMIGRLLAEHDAIGSLPSDRLAQALHRLRGSANVVGATALAAAAGRADDALRQGATDLPPALLEDLVQALDRLRAAARQPLQAEAERLAAAQFEAGAAEPPPLAANELDELVRLVEQHNVRAAARVDEWAARLVATIGQAGFERVRAALQEFDFSAAAQELHRSPDSPALPARR